MEQYEITVEGHLPKGWSEWLGGMAIQHQADGSSCLQGALPDQAALHGVLARIRDLNLRLLAVVRLPDSSLEQSKKHV